MIWRRLAEFGMLIGPAGEKSDVIARAVAAGIALGREEALASVHGRDGQSHANKASAINAAQVHTLAVLR
jgi:hypothetical protein